MDGQQFLPLAVQIDRLLQSGGVATDRWARGLPSLSLTTDIEYQQQLLHGPADTVLTDTVSKLSGWAEGFQLSPEP